MRLAGEANQSSRASRLQPSCEFALISASDWKPSICSVRPSGHVSSMYHALPSFSARGVIVGVDALIMGHYAPITAQCKLDRIGGTALGDACSPRQPAQKPVQRPGACTH